MIKNTLDDLNNHLFEMIERVMDDDYQGEEAIQEIRRANSVVRLSAEIVSIAHAKMQAHKYVQEYSGDDLPLLLGEV